MFNDLTTILYNLFPKIEEEETCPNSCYETSIILIPKQDTLQKRKLKSHIPHEYRHKDP